jgi:hypothetical protein
MGCITNPLPLEDLLIVRHSNKTIQVMMHGDDSAGVDRLKELDPGPSTHDGIHVDADQGTSHKHYPPVPPPPVVSNHIISAFQQGHQAFPLVKVKTTNDNTHGCTYPFSVNPSVATEPLDYGENLFHYASIQHMWHYLISIL